MKKPETKSAAYEDGKITLTGGIPFPMVLIRK